LSWVDTSDDNAALQWLPNNAPRGNGTFSCPTLYVGNSTGAQIRGLIGNGEIDTMTVVLDAPSTETPTYTLIGHLEGRSGATDTILLYTHSMFQTQSEKIIANDCSISKAMDLPLLKKMVSFAARNGSLATKRE
jgi:hypothetical protein